MEVKIIEEIGAIVSAKGPESERSEEEKKAF